MEEPCVERNKAKRPRKGEGQSCQVAIRPKSPPFQGPARQEGHKDARANEGRNHKHKAHPLRRKP